MDDIVPRGPGGARRPLNQAHKSMRTTRTKGQAATTDMVPEIWKAAFERNQSGDWRYAGPAPERKAARVLAAFIVTGLAFLALPGTLLGVWNLISIAERHTSNGASVAWIQAHGHAQLFGWVGTFILGISLYVLPKFQGRMPKRFAIAWAVWVLWTTGVAVRWWVGVETRQWRVGLVASAVLELGALALALYYVLSGRAVGATPALSQKVPRDLGSWMGMAAFGALGVALLLNLVISIQVAQQADLPVYPAVADRVFLLIALWGFAVPMAWGYSTRFVTIFLSLAPPHHRAARWVSLGVAALVISVLAKQFLLADILALLLTLLALWALRIFQASLGPPKVIGVYRHYPVFVRASYGWLAVGAVLGVLADLFASQSGWSGASRHAVTVGFLATLVFALAPRILPSFLNGRELYSFRLMAASLWVLNAGCSLRVLSESIAYSAGGWAWRALPISALLELSAVILFVTNLGGTLGRPVPAWFGPEEVRASMPLYWYITSYPSTRRLLVEAGLKTLGRRREVPRSLTLADAAKADGADLTTLLRVLRGFFATRQPRRARRST